MNKRQKLVQQQFLNNEEAVIKRLEQVYGVALKDIDGNIEQLMKRFDPVTGDLPQSAVYQIKYQKMLKGQIEGILNQMQTNQYLTVSDYLSGCYEDGFIGSLFDLHGQGVPLAMPIDQTKLIRAVQLDSKISQGLYSRLGEDVGLLKKKITAQVSRSILTGDSFAQTAQQLAGYTRIGYNRAVRIARTEGHRIQTAATMDTMHNAKERGADVVKQWDATLDGLTRESHVVVDGEIRELDEAFSNGLDYPGDPDGGAAEVVNCRCALLQRARWAVGDSFTKWDSFSDTMESFESPDDYGEFKKSFFSPGNKDYMNYVQRMEQKYGTKDFAKVLDKMTDKEYQKYSKLLKNNPLFNTAAPASVDKFKEITDTMDFAYGNYSKDDFIKWMDAYDKHNSGVQLSAEELKIIDDYTEGSFIALNDVSRYSDAELLKKGYSAEDIQRIRKKADMLEGALSKYDLDTDIVTHRFERDVSWLTGNGNGIEELEKLIGKEYTTEGFTSSGMLPNRFRFTGGKKDAVHFEIVTPKGTDGAFLSMSKKGENEFLYNRNTRYRVLDGGERVVKESKLNIRTMQMEEVEVKERFLKVQVIVDDVDDIAGVITKPVFTPATLDDFPTVFRKNSASKKATQTFGDALNEAEDLDPHIRKLYTRMGDLPGIPADCTVSYTGKGHAVTSYINRYTGEVTKCTVKVPKMLGDDLMGQKSTAFHELGHFIDMGAGKDGKWLSRTNQKLTDAIKSSGKAIPDDIQDLFDDFGKQYNTVRDTLSRTYREQRNALTSDYRAGQMPWSEYDKRWKALIREEDAERDYQCRNLCGGGVSMLSDIYDALSRGTYRDNGTLIYGHGGKYYRHAGSAESEIFANYMSLSVNKPDLVEMLRKDKPDLCKALDEMIEEMAGGIK